MIESVAKKIGMASVYIDNQHVPITVLKPYESFVAQVKTVDNDGYRAVQIAYGNSHEKNKAHAGHFKRSSKQPLSHLLEISLQGSQFDSVSPGDAYQPLIDQWEMVTVKSKSKGKGFAGCIKRHNFKMQPATHGNSLSHRVPGSTGQCQDPGRVFKGKKMAGQMGSSYVTKKGLKVIYYDERTGVIALKGSVPGAKGATVFIQPVKLKKNEGK
jgi:large subunit ribosomal protein L3